MSLAAYVAVFLMGYMVLNKEPELALVAIPVEV
jgi:hypothetical protein